MTITHTLTYISDTNTNLHKHMAGIHTWFICLYYQEILRGSEIRLDQTLDRAVLRVTYSLKSVTVLGDSLCESLASLFVLWLERPGP